MIELAEPIDLKNSFLLHSITLCYEVASKLHILIYSLVLLPSFDYLMLLLLLLLLSHFSRV